MLTRAPIQRCVGESHTLMIYLQVEVFDGWLEFAGLENDGVKQEQKYILHTMKNFNVYDM